MIHFIFIFPTKKFSIFPKEKLVVTWSVRYFPDWLQMEYDIMDNSPPKEHIISWKGIKKLFTNSDIFNDYFSNHDFEQTKADLDVLTKAMALSRDNLHDISSWYPLLNYTTWDWTTSKHYDHDYSGIEGCWACFHTGALSRSKEGRCFRHCQVS